MLALRLNAVGQAGGEPASSSEDLEHLTLCPGISRPAPLILSPVLLAHLALFSTPTFAFIVLYSEQFQPLCLPESGGEGSPWGEVHHVCPCIPAPL